MRLVQVLHLGRVVLVPVGLARLGEQDERGRIGRLGREREVEEDERIRVPVGDDRERVERDPEDDRDRLPDDVLRRPEEPRRPLCPLAEPVGSERPVGLGGHAHSTRVRAASDGARVPRAKIHS